MRSRPVRRMVDRRAALPQEGPGRTESPVNSPSKSKRVRNPNEPQRQATASNRVATPGARRRGARRYRASPHSPCKSSGRDCSRSSSARRRTRSARWWRCSSPDSRSARPSPHAWSTRVSNPVAALATCLALAVGFGALSRGVRRSRASRVAAVVARPDVTFAQVLAARRSLAIALLAPMTIAFGAAFPFAVAVGTRRDETVTTDLGLIYAVNTAGAIAGALLAGFVLIPMVGLHGTIRVVTVVGAVGALALCFAGSARGRGGCRRRAPLAVAVLVLGRPAPAVESSAAVERRLQVRLRHRSSQPADRAHRRRTALLRRGAERHGRGPQGWRHDLTRHRRQGRCLERRGHADAAAAGARAAACCIPIPRGRHSRLGKWRHARLGADSIPIDRADVLEISPEVVEASRYFESREPRALEDPTNASHRRRWTDPPVVHAPAIRRDRVRAVQPLDGGDRLALHQGVLRGCARAAEARRRALPVGPHLRHQHRGPAVDRRHVHVRLS